MGDLARHRKQLEANGKGHRLLHRKVMPWRQLDGRPDGRRIQDAELRSSDGASCALGGQSFWLS